MDLAHRRLTPDFTFICFWRRHELRQLWLMRVPPLVCLCLFPGVFLSFRVTGACPVTTDLIMRVNVRTTTTRKTFRPAVCFRLATFCCNFYWWDSNRRPKSPGVWWDSNPRPEKRRICRRRLSTVISGRWDSNPRLKNPWSVDDAVCFRN